jgi:hypothetical protein
MEDEFRVEVDLDDHEHGYSLGERLRALDLDDEIRKRLEGGVMVTRDGSRLFLYAASDAAVRAAERTVRELVEADDLSAEIRVTRWHPVEESWKDATDPLPATPEQERREYAAREAAEAEEARVEGRSDWQVVAHLPGRDQAAELADGSLTTVFQQAPLAVRRCGCADRGARKELAGQLRSELLDADVRVEVDLSDAAKSPLQFLPF